MMTRPVGHRKKNMYLSIKKKTGDRFRLFLLPWVLVAVDDRDPNNHSPILYVIVLGVLFVVALVRLILSERFDDMAPQSYNSLATTCSLRVKTIFCTVQASNTLGCGDMTILQ